MRPIFSPVCAGVLGACAGGRCGWLLAQRLSQWLLLGLQEDI